MFQNGHHCETRLYHIPLVFYVYMDEVMKDVKMGMGRMGVRFLEKGREWRLPDLLYADDLILWQIGRRAKGYGWLFG